MTLRWGLSYNLYADRLHGSNTFPRSVYETREFFPVALYVSRVTSITIVQRKKQGHMRLTPITSESGWTVGEEFISDFSQGTWV